MERVLVVLNIPSFFHATYFTINNKLFIEVKYCYQCRYIKTVPGEDIDLKSKKRLWLRVEYLLYAHFAISIIDAQ